MADLVIDIEVGLYVLLIELQWRERTNLAVCFVFITEFIDDSVRRRAKTDRHQMVQLHTDTVRYKL